MSPIVYNSVIIYISVIILESLSEPFKYIDLE